MLEAFHFLRPLWLLAIAPALFLAFCIWRRQDSTLLWRGVIAPHLLRHLRMGRSRKHRMRPVTLLALAWTIASLALAGPTWKREPTPFAEDTAALAIVLEVTPGMLAQDIQPSRLERAVHKIEDLLELRPGTKTTLIAYSGSAHLVMPLTRDAEIIQVFAAELTPEILPVDGNAVGEALELAAQQLVRTNAPGSILLVTDGVPVDQVDSLTAATPVHVLAMGTEAGAPTTLKGPPATALDVSALAQVADRLDGSLTVVSADDRDVRRLIGQIKRSLVVSRQHEKGERWHDSGYWLVPLLVLICLMWFRPGWTVAYS